MSKCIFIFSIVLAFDCFSAAGSDFSHLELRFKSKKTDPTLNEAHVIEACDNVGSFLVQGQGAFGTGIFKNYSCFLGDKLLKGQKSQDDWRLEIFEDDDLVWLQFYFNDSRGTEPLWKRSEEFYFKVDRRPLFALRDRALTEGLALLLLDKLQVLYRLDGKLTKFTVGRGITDTYFLSFPDELRLFYFSELRRKRYKHLFGQGQFDKISNVIRLTRVQDLSPDTIFLDATVSGVITERIARQIYQMTGGKPSSPYRSLLEGIAGGVTDSFAAGYVGVRYALSLVKEPDVMAKQTNISVVTEVRSGVLGGMRLFFDMVPKTSGNWEGLPASFQSTRLAMGYSFKFNVTSYGGGFFDLIDVAPRLGLWNLTANLPVKQPSGIQVQQDFKLNNALSFGLEIGIEKQIEWLLVRAWYGVDGADGGLISTGSFVAANRFGIDSVFRGHEFQHFNLDYMASLWVEHLNMQNKKAGDDEVEKLKYLLAFAGGGIALSW